MLTLRYRLEVLCFQLLIGLTRIVPRRVMLALGSFLGTLGFLLDGRHRRITLENLTRSFGKELEPREIRRIARNCWRHFGRITVDSFYHRRLTRESVDALVQIEGGQHLLDAVARGKGVLVYSAHFGHWELGAVVAGFYGVPMAIIARPLSNPGLEPLLTSLRSISGNQIIYKRNAIREMLKALRAGMCVAIMIDQDAREHGIFVPFFGRPASTTPTLASLALRTGAAIVPVSCVPMERGRYRLVVEPEVEVRATADAEEEIFRLTAECTTILERWVRRHPDQWLWMHRRWKTEPLSAPPEASAPGAASAEVS